MAACPDGKGFNVIFEHFKVKHLPDQRRLEWLKKNAEKYGFVLRYPKDKEDITKIAYESWHWRYVGAENAKKMNELNMCLEEYIQYLKTH